MRPGAIKGITLPDQPAPGEILIPADRIAARVSSLAAELARAYAGRDPVLVAIMKGCVLFLADLVRAWPAVMDIEFVTARSYRGTEPGEVQLTLPAELAEVARGRPVLVVDDIFDTGRTLGAVCRAVEKLRPADLQTLVFLRKRRAGEGTGGQPTSPKQPLRLRRPKAASGTRGAAGVSSVAEPDWVGFEIEDRFVVGYGLDLDGRYRNLPYVAALAKG
jgi:hypoxanthine phosphoribosyltransferase